MNLVFITGGSRGLGAALVEQYRAEGWAVVELSRSGVGEGHVPVDLGDPTAAVAVAATLFAQQAQQDWEKVVLINNAAMLAPIAPLQALDDAAISRNLDVNISAGIRLIAAFARSFHGHGARRIIANISSGAARKGNIGWTLYCAAKAGLEHFINVLALEQAAEPRPITCLTIDPGLIDSAMQGEIRASAPQDFPAVGRFIAYQATGKLRPPAEVAAAVRQILAGSPAQGGRYAVADQLS